ncbi:SseB family protein [Streptosporangium sp. NPDC002607]
MTDTPLSDVMDAHVQANTAETYAAFVEMFRNSVIGIIGVGLLEPDGRAGEGFSASQTTHGDGRPRILTFADPEVASQAPGSQCNVGIPGAVLLRMAAEDPSCEGILVNSATKLISIIISRASASAIAQGPV